MKLRYRAFARRGPGTGWQLSEIGFGMSGMGGWTKSDDAESRRSLQLAVDPGYTLGAQVVILRRRAAIG